MNALAKMRLLAHVLRWRLTWNRRETHYHFAVPGNPKFMSACDAAQRVPDGAVVMSSGLGGNARPSTLYWAIRERFEATGRPRGLTVMSVGGIGGRGRVPGTLEELGLPGLCARFVSGHLETFKAMLRLAGAGQIELQCLPQGVLALLLDGQGRGESSLVTKVGVGTFMDPRTGRGTPVLDPGAPQHVEVAEGNALRYTIPKVDVALFNLPAADREGNLYARNAAMVAECRELARAARSNGGIVIANVGLVVDKGWGDVFLPAEMVDAVVPWPGTEQTATVPHRAHWPLFTLDSDMPLEEGIARLRFINRVLGVTPRRGDVDAALARLAASVFADHVPKGAFVNVGVGLPEEVCRVMHDGGLTKEITLFTESGVLGGLPAPGVFFGAAVCPERMISSAATFRMCQERLDCTILGALEVDGDGNVNLSRRGDRAIDMVGPGGSMDLTSAADTVIFVGSWMAHARIAIQRGRVAIVRGGRPKFVARVGEVTFSGREALRAGKKVFYCTNVGAFRLTPRGMELMCVMPGIDVGRDVLAACPMPVVLPESGHVPVVGDAIVTGRGFRLEMKNVGRTVTTSLA